ncbi:NADPH-dependent aldehyde reductase-like protein, chloroplastic [Wolffia australiana]
MAAQEPSISSSSSSLPLLGRVAIVTGASRGIGRAIASHLAALGAHVVASFSASSATADALVAEINSSAGPSKAIAVRADVRQSAQVKALFDAAEAAFGGPAHILVHSAGVLDPAYPAVAATEEESWNWVLEVNAKGAFLCCREAANRLARGGGGRIIVLSSSVVGSLPAGYGSYAASKAAVEAMVKVVAKELKGTGITANCVAPGPVATEMFFAGKSEEMVERAKAAAPLGRLGETGDVAPLVGFLASDGGEWVNAQVVRVNGGYV